MFRTSAHHCKSSCLPNGLPEHPCFICGGAIDYQKLSPGHRAAMALLYQSLRKTPPEKQTAEDQALVETYGKRVDFVDFSALSPILEALLK